MTTFKEKNKLDEDIFMQRKDIVKFHNRLPNFLDYILSSMFYFYDKYFNINISTQGYVLMQMSLMSILFKEYFQYRTFSLFYGESGVGKTTAPQIILKFLGIMYANVKAMDISRAGMIRSNTPSGSVLGLAQTNDVVIIDEVNKKNFEQIDVKKKGYEDDNIFEIMKNFSDLTASSGKYVNDSGSSLAVDCIVSSLILTGNIYGSTSVEFFYNKIFYKIIDEEMRNTSNPLIQKEIEKCKKLKQYLQPIAKYWEKSKILARLHYKTRIQLRYFPALLLPPEYSMRVGILGLVEGKEGQNELHFQNKDQKKEKKNAWNDYKNAQISEINNVRDSIDNTNNVFASFVHDCLDKKFKIVSHNYLSKDNLASVFVNGEEITGEQRKNYAIKISQIICDFCKNLPTNFDKDINYMETRTQNQIECLFDNPIMLVMMNQEYLYHIGITTERFWEKIHLTEYDKSLIKYYFNFNFNTLSFEEVSAEKEIKVWQMTEEMYEFCEREKIDDGDINELID